MKKSLVTAAIVLCTLATLPAAFAITAVITNGQVTDIGFSQLATDFGMLVGAIQFRLGTYVWPPTEVWLIPADISPAIFSKGLTQKEVLQIPENITWSTCRTAVYFNTTVGYGFKIYNTGTTTQILQNGTFCGLAYNGTYFVFAKF